MRLPLWASVLTLLGLCILCGLGAWQLQRLQWKNDLIEQLDQAYDGGPATALDLDNIHQDYVYGRVSGTFLPDKALLLGPRAHEGEVGYDLIVPLQVAARERGAARTLLVNMGWSAWALDDMPIHHLQGRAVSFDGLVIRPRWNGFTPENVPGEEQWYKLDIEQIAAVRKLENPYPFILRAEQANYKFDAAFPNNDRLYPNNNHLQYALFWFAMAGALLAVYVFRFVAGREKAR